MKKFLSDAFVAAVLSMLAGMGLAGHMRLAALSGLVYSQFWRSASMWVLIFTISLTFLLPVMVFLIFRRKEFNAQLVFKTFFVLFTISFLIVGNIGTFNSAFSLYGDDAITAYRIGVWMLTFLLVGREYVKIKMKNKNKPKDRT